MDDIRLKYFKPIMVGTPTGNPLSRPSAGTESKTSFQDILQNQLNKDSEVVFSKHAAKRVAERNIHLTDDSLARLSAGMRMANEKNLNDALILVDKTAFVVNAPSNTVITTKDNEEMQGSIFTNISGTVII